MTSVRIASGKEACVLQLLQQPHSVCTCGVTLVGAFASAYVFCVLYSLIITRLLVCSAYGDFRAVRNFVLVTQLVTRSGASNSSY